MPWTRFDFDQRFREHPTVKLWARHVRNQPSWVWKAAIVCGLLILVVPIVVMTLTAVLAFVSAFLVFSVLYRISRAIGEMKQGKGVPGHRGRQNVRVIRVDRY